MNSRLIFLITLIVFLLGLGGAVAWWKWIGPGKTGLVQGIEATPTFTAEPGPEATPTNLPTPKPTIAEVTTSGEPAAIQGCITIRVLNARIGPGKEYPAAGGLGKGECVGFDARSADNRWLRVNGRYAESGDRLWAHADFITLEGDINDLPESE